MRVAFLLLLLLATLVNAWWMLGAYRREHEVVQTLRGMRRLAALVIQDFPDRNPPVEAGGREFWKRLGRAGPILDPWGSDFRLERREAPSGPPLFVWRSAGPDREWSTADDLEVVVPFL